MTSQFMDRAFTPWRGWERARVVMGVGAPAWAGVVMCEGAPAWAG